jgi:hypothetical protein
VEILLDVMYLDVKRNRAVPVRASDVDALGKMGTGRTSQT